MPDPNVVHPDEYELVRGVPAQKEWIKNVEERLGAKLIPDAELDLLKKLDKNLRAFRLQATLLPNKSQHPKDRRFTSKTNYYYYEEIPIPVGIYLTGMPTIQTHNLPTPAWFRVHRNLAMMKPGNSTVDHKETLTSFLKGTLLS